MAKNIKWQDDYWLLLLQVYLQKPVGIKPMYSRRMVDLSLELHVSPSVLFNKMCQVANLETPRIERFWETYGENPRKLARAVHLYREMKGFNNADEFYEGVETNESFERDFKPVAEGEKFTPMMLILILDLYFLAEVLEVFQYCDPYLRRKEVTFSPLFLPCQQVWRRFGNANPEELASFANQLKEYFK